MRSRKAISPVIATVIIIAVAIAISIAVAGWIMGLWGGFGQTESLKIYPDSYADDATDKVYLHVQNTGGSTIEIIRVLFNGNDATPNVTTIDSGVETWIEITPPTGTDIVGGVNYNIQIITAAGNTYTATVYGR